MNVEKCYKEVPMPKLIHILTISKTTKAKAQQQPASNSKYEICTRQAVAAAADICLARATEFIERNLEEQQLRSVRGSERAPGLRGTEYVSIAGGDASRGRGRQRRRLRGPRAR